MANKGRARCRRERREHWRLSKAKWRWFIPTYIVVSIIFALGILAIGCSPTREIPSTSQVPESTSLPQPTAVVSPALPTEKQAKQQLKATTRPDQLTAPEPTYTPAPKWQGEISTEAFTWSGRWIEFVEGPNLCGEILTVKGRARNNAVVEQLHDRLAYFSIFRKSNLMVQPGGSTIAVIPVLSFLPMDRYHPSSVFQFARRLSVSEDGESFELVSWVPAEVSEDPSDFAFGVHGKLPTGKFAVLRVTHLQVCEAG